MARRIAISTLNASTYDILNTIRANATAEYQSLVPEVKVEHDIPKVGDILFGYPALANQFLSSLVNRIALVRVRGAVFNNAYAELKKGYLEFGETVEEVFVGIAKARVFSAEKAEQRELKRTLPDVKTAFHAMNWRVQYPVTIQQEDLRMAFMSVNGVQDLIAKIVDAVYTGAEYDEFLLFKYLLIKAIAHGKATPMVGSYEGDIEEAAISFRGASNGLTFLSNKYNAMGVRTSTPKKDQYIFMSSDFNARYDVKVLASAFNMEMADFSGRLHLIDDWTSFDNERFDDIIAESDMIEPVTEEELALMKHVEAVLVDKEWFQVYDNMTQFTEKYVGSGMYWNYFYNVWKTVSSSPFSNIIVFVNGMAEDTAPYPATFTAEIVNKAVSENATIFTISVETENATFVQTENAVENGVAIHPYGAIIIPKECNADITLCADIFGNKYTAESAINTTSTVGTKITFDLVVA